MSKSFRTTISVPADLKARMNAIDQDVNWSAVACRAFEKKLAEVITKKRSRQMNDVITRLKASKQETEDARSKQGWSEGEEWAKLNASYAQLERLDKLKDEPEIDIMTQEHDGTSAYGPAELLFFAIEPESDGDREAALNFWNLVNGDYPDTKEFIGSQVYLLAFCEGACSVYAQAKDQL